jgi:ubiquinone/menaquinone biosynthesis C-methylase UbiE
MIDLTPEMAELKSRLKTTWNSGDYGRLAKPLEESAAEFLATIRFDPGMDVLDLACDTGQVAFPAARAGAKVTGIDIAPNSIEQARARADEEGLNIRFDEGDAEALPYDDASFDIIVSLIGAMFAPRPELVTAEMIRVCRPGGRIVMGNWTPGGFIGQMLKAVAKHVPPPPEMASPILWGDESTVRERLAEGITTLELTTWMYPFRYQFSPAQVTDYYFEHYGPTNRAYAVLDDAGRKALREEFTNLWDSHNQATDGTTRVEAELLRVEAVRG